MIVMRHATYEDYVEYEEFITVEEYFRRRASGKLDPMSVRISPPDIRTGDFGGFMVKLDTPRYRPPQRRSKPTL
jgi:hypothetical protein